MFHSIRVGNKEFSDKFRHFFHASNPFYSVTEGPDKASQLQLKPGQTWESSAPARRRSSRISLAT